MKQILVSWIFVHMILNCQAQENIILEQNDTIFYNDTIPKGVRLETEKRAEFLGGEDTLISYIKQHFQYPKSAIKDSIEGIVYIRFSIDEKGNIGDISILKGIHPEIEAECRQKLLEMPRWKPAIQLTNSKKGWYWRPIKTWHSIGLNFALTNKKNLKGIIITP